MIRAEKQDDKSQIATLIARTYGAAGAETIAQTGQLRSLEVYSSKLSFVSETDTKIEAFALFTPVKMEGDAKGVVLAPFALDIHKLDFDVVGFLNHCFSEIESQGYSYIFAMGNLEDLSALGFVYADSLNLSVNQSLEATLLVKKVKGPNTTGLVEFPETLLVE